MRCVVAIDQSTQGTKAVLFDDKGKLIGRADRKHKQIVNEKGWISHDLKEIYENTISCKGSTGLFRHRKRERGSDRNQ